MCSIPTEPMGPRHKILTNHEVPCGGLWLGHVASSHWTTTYKIQPMKMRHPTLYEATNWQARIGSYMLSIHIDINSMAAQSTGKLVTLQFF